MWLKCEPRWTWSQSRLTQPFSHAVCHRKPLLNMCRHDSAMVFCLFSPERCLQISLFFCCLDYKGAFLKKMFIWQKKQVVMQRRTVLPACHPLLGLCQAGPPEKPSRVVVPPMRMPASGAQGRVSLSCSARPTAITCRGVFHLWTGPGPSKHASWRLYLHSKPQCPPKRPFRRKTETSHTYTHTHTP